MTELLTTGSGRPRRIVELEVDPIGRQHWGLISGLMTLARRGELTLKLTTPSAPRERGSIFCTVHDQRRGTRSRICFDLQDAQDLGSPERSALADITFKRSYGTPEMYGDVDVRPLGLTAPYRTGREKHLTHYTLRAVMRAARHRNSWRLAANHAAMAAGFPLQRFGLGIPGVSPTHLGLFERPEASRRSEGHILFQVRAWEPDQGIDPEDREHVNSQRAELIRILRAEFGPRFLGGFIQTPYVVHKFPDCVTPFPTSRKAYAELIHKSSIGISTVGLHRSNGWKLVEYLASGVPIVSEPLASRLPVELVDGKNALFFSSPIECVAACRALLANQELRVSMSQNNIDFYQQEVRPEQLLVNRFDDIAASRGRYQISAGADRP